MAKDKEYIAKLKTMSTGEILAELIASLVAGQNKFKYEVAELQVRFEEIDAKYRNRV